VLFCNFDGKIVRLVTNLKMIGKGLYGKQKIEGEYPYTKETKYTHIYCAIISGRYEYRTYTSGISN